MIPGRTIVKCAAGAERTAALFARCTSAGRTPAAASASTAARKRSTWARAEAVSTASAEAKWEKTPAMDRPGSSRTAAPKAPTSAGSRPSRVMPVSTLIWMPIIRPAARAAAASASAAARVQTATSRSPATTAVSSPGKAPPSTTTGPRTPARRSSVPSSTVDTPSAAAPASTKARAAATAPWPYPSALTTASTFTPGPTRSRAARRFVRSAPRLTSATVGLPWMSCIRSGSVEISRISNGRTRCEPRKRWQRLKREVLCPVVGGWARRSIRQSGALQLRPSRASPLLGQRRSRRARTSWMSRRPSSTARTQTTRPPIS